jgi:zinc transporter ZupT
MDTVGVSIQQRFEGAAITRTRARGQSLVRLLVAVASSGFASAVGKAAAAAAAAFVSGPRP